MSEITEAADRLEEALDPDKREGWTRLEGQDRYGHSEIADLRTVIAAARESQAMSVMKDHAEAELTLQRQRSDRAWEVINTDYWRNHHDALVAEVESLTAQLQAAQAIIDRLRLISNVNGDWNIKYMNAKAEGKAEALRESSRLLDGSFYHVGEGETPFHPGQEYEGHMLQRWFVAMLQRWFEARAASIEQTEATKCVNSTRCFDA